MKKKLKKNDLRSKHNQDELLVSVCLIARNEEKYIEQCLRSVKRVADEIILVDTGSTDRTVELARKFTDRIYFHPWQDSFSEAGTITSPTPEGSGSFRSTPTRSSSGRISPLYALLWPIRTWMPLWSRS